MRPNYVGVLFVGPALAAVVIAWYLVAFLWADLVVVAFTLAVSSIVQVERDGARDACTPAIARRRRR